MSKKLVAIVPAAGIGQRARATVRSPSSGLDPAGSSLLGGAAQAVLPKQYRLLRGEPMLRWTVRALLAEKRIAQVRVIAADGDGRVLESVKGLPRVAVRFCGGATRADTVEAALRDAAFGDDVWVLVHDAARPGLPADALARLIDTCLAHDLGGLLAMPVSDTVKQEQGAQGRAEPEGGAAERDTAERDATERDAAERDAAGRGGLPCVSRVARTMPREGLWQAQTPQMFPASALLSALQAAREGGSAITDEASAMELKGWTPALVIGSMRNFKVTWPGDFDLIEKWL